MSYYLGISEDFENPNDKEYYIRGKIISKASHIEALIDVYISNFLAKEDQILMIQKVILTRVSFENKRQIFQYLFEEKNKAVSTKYKELCNLLQEVNTQRNLFAHNMGVPPDNGVIDAYYVRLLKQPMKIGQLRESEAIKRLTYTKEEIIELLRLMDDTIDLLYKVLDATFK